MTGLDFGMDLFKRDRQEYTDNGEAKVQDTSVAHQYAIKTVSATQVDGTIGETYDGSSTTMLNLRSADNETQDQSILYDLGQVRKVRNIYTYCDPYCGWGATSTFRVKYSNDNSTWTNLREQTGLTGNGGYNYVTTGGNFKARYIKIERVTTSGTVGSGGYNGLELIEVNIWT